MEFLENRKNMDFKKENSYISHYDISSLDIRFGNASEHLQVIHKLYTTNKSYPHITQISYPQHKYIYMKHKL